MKIYRRAVVLQAVILWLTAAAAADRGSFAPSRAVLSQDSQKAVIFHNKKQEILILATELKADLDTKVLEFIPFPAEPAVSLVKGDPFEKVRELLKKKDIMMEAEFGKGGGGTAPVDIKLSERIGLHDVTVVKVNQASEFESWVREFFKRQSLPIQNSLEAFLANARDYLSRGLNYFVFDSVTVGRKARLAEPLAYRFDSDRLYYPLKTSNLVGGYGAVEIILVLPGSFYTEGYRDEELIPWFRSGWRVSSSSKMFEDDISLIYPEARGFFAAGQRPYLQMLSFSGAYDFKEDLNFDVSSLPQYGHKIGLHTGYGLDYEQKMTEAEMRDFLRAKCLQDGSFLKNSLLLNEHLTGYLLTSGLTCTDFVQPEEYRVIAALFQSVDRLSSVRLDGLPGAEVVLEDMSVQRQAAGGLKAVSKALLDDYNQKNRKQHDLAEDVPEELAGSVRFRRYNGPSPFSPGKTYISRVGFDPDKKKALVFVSHVAAPEMGVGYLVLLEKTAGGWSPAAVLDHEIY